jgi:hypothetical protein
MDILNWLAFLLALVSSVGLLLHRNWRWGISWLAFLYLIFFWLVQTQLPIPMATAKLVTGWMACTILSIAQFNKSSVEEGEVPWPQGRLFRLFATGIMMATSFALSLSASIWLGLGLPITWGSLLLIGMGLLQLGFSSQPFRVIIGLLTVLAGYEIIYATVESSTLVAALLSVVNLGLALAGAYFLNTPFEELP